MCATILTIKLETCFWAMYRGSPVVIGRTFTASNTAFIEHEQNAFPQLSTGRLDTSSVWTNIRHVSYASNPQLVSF
jgi:hypothetical protein